MLALHVEFLAGRFTASAYNDRHRGEWPPHPARIFSALVDALYDADEVDHGEAAALDALSEAGAPWVIASAASQRRVVTNYVPVNDTAACEQATLFTREAKLLAAEQAVATAAGLPDKKRKALDKKLVKARSDLKKEAKKRALHDGKYPKKLETRSLPWKREKQPRTFPTCLPAAPRVTYVFDTDAVAPEALADLLGRVARIGHSSSPVAACAETVDTLPRDDRKVWHPVPRRRSADDISLRVPLPDQRALLDDLFQIDADKPGRTMPYSIVRYGPGASQAASEAGHTDRTHGRWLSFVLERSTAGAGSDPPAHAVVAYAEAFRDTLAARAGRPTLLTGLADGAPAHQPHAAFVGLPFVGRRHADGALRGLALVLPNDADDDELSPVWRAIADWEREATDEHAVKQLEVPLGEQTFALRRVIDPEVELKALRPARWVSTPAGEPACTWATVTPIALGGTCPPFRHDKASVRRKARRRAVRLIQRAAARAVRPPPGRQLSPREVELKLRFDPVIVGTPPASRFPRYQRPGHDRPRRLVHALLHFPFPVRGPLLLGSGRHLGLGLCLPLGGH